MYFGEQQIEEMNQKDAQILHSAIADKFSEIYYNIELAKSFLEQNPQLIITKMLILLIRSKKKRFVWKLWSV